MNMRRKIASKDKLKACDCDNFGIAMKDGSDWEAYGAALGPYAMEGEFNFSSDTDTIRFCPWCGKKLRKLRPHGKCGVECKDCTHYHERKLGVGVCDKNPSPLCPGGRTMYGKMSACDNFEPRNPRK